MRALIAAVQRRRWLRNTLIAFGAVAVVSLSVGAFFWVRYGRMIEARLGGDQRPSPRIFGRPLELRVRQGLSPAQLVERLNDIGYAGRPKVEQPGEFSVAGNTVTVSTRSVEGSTPQTVRVDFSAGSTPVIAKLTALGHPRGVDSLTLEAPMLAAFAPGEKRRHVSLDGIPPVMIQAVISIEDRRFFDHSGVDVIRAVGALITNLRGDRPYLVGASTLTQQIVKNTFLTPKKTLRRKLQEQFMALVLETRFTKNQILELYLNDVVLGQRGPFEIHGVAEASRIFFGKDVCNVTLAEAATIAGVIQSPSRLSPFRNQERATERRNLVLRTMAEAGYITRDAADAAARTPLGVAVRALENEAPYFVDYVSQQVDEKYTNLFKTNAAVNVYTTLDLNLQRIAQEAVSSGLIQVDKQLARRQKQGQAEAALVAVDPRTGEILAFVGGRAYSESQFNRAVAARRQPGSVFKPFVYLAAFERMAAEGRSDLTPATIIVDEATTFRDSQGNDYTPGNFESKFAGPVTLRNALAHSRNIIAVKVAQTTGFDRIADLWHRITGTTTARPYPSIALGVFEATPLDIAGAYTLFTNSGAVRPLRTITRILENDATRPLAPAPALNTVARADTTFLVTNMLRSVLDEGTGAGARAAGFTLNAAGKSGTSNDLRDAWFVGFTPELLTVVWVGFDNNQPIGLTGSQAALPIWTTFMKRALAGRANLAFETAAGVTFADIDPETGQLATTECPRTVREAFLAGTEPTDSCELHGGNPVSRAFSKIGQFFGRIIR